MTRATAALLRVGADDGVLASALNERGIDASVTVVADIVDRSDAALLAEVGDLAAFAWVAVTSRHAARRLGLWTNWPESVRVGAVGPSTAAALGATGVRCDVVAPDGTAGGLAACIERGPVLFLAGAQARDELPELLSSRGVRVDVVRAYRVVPRRVDPSVLELLARSEAVVALSPSALDAVLDSPGGDEALRAPALVAIGPTTAAQARSRGVRVDAVASARDPDAIAEAILVALGAAPSRLEPPS